MRLSLCAGLALVPVSALAAPLTFNAALERAAADAPALRGSAAGVEAAQSAAIAADRLPDPTLDLGIKDFPVTGPDAGNFNRDNFTMTTIGVSQRSSNRPAVKRRRSPEMLRYVCRVQGRLRGRCMIAAEWVP